MSNDRLKLSELKSTTSTKGTQRPYRRPLSTQHTIPFVLSLVLLGLVPCTSTQAVAQAAFGQQGPAPRNDDPNQFWNLVHPAEPNSAPLQGSASSPTSQEHAPCPLGDGIQTVTFGNGASYTGPFQNCRPLEGEATYTAGRLKIKGHAKPIADGKVLLQSLRGRVIISLVTSDMKRARN